MRVFVPKIPSVLNRVRQLEALEVPVVALAREYPAGHLVDRHCHDRAQLVYASQGVLRVDTPDGIWVVPPLRAIWVPAGVDHELRASTPVCLRTLFVQAGLRDTLPAECSVVEVSPLLRELILRVIAAGEVPEPQGANVHMIELILDEIRPLQVGPTCLALPVDPRAFRICRALLDDPADPRTCAQWGAHVGASSRTVERLFQRETGVSFRIWRQQVRLLAAFPRLASQTPISNVALDLGYRSPSAFTTMFRRTLGCPPSEFFHAHSESR